MSLIFFLLQALRPKDTGPIYTETNMENWIVEPFNAASAILFVLVVGYWFWKLRGQYRHHLFLTFVLPVLLIGGIGGTLYHAFRNSEFFLVMDWLPIMLLTLAASMYFLVRVLGKWYYAFATFVVVFLMQWLTYLFVPQRYAINVSYAITGLYVLIPVWMMMAKTQYRHSQHVWWSLLSFGLALFFRSIDPMALLPMGTHFLWHVFGAGACHGMLMYTYLINLPEEVPASEAV
ncbi:hypothetical protein [Pontibacter sp. G13]|uniref:hypothetical protein n=1 Tax=Pontibacter sp. G13 TaxID=3074898 RepID=UPI0028891A41|nr:hypothetical protein [Pontibacter sp. G13]WNJ17076.1 hypothetical protein RJD25_19655 [Pontibacter sp. G13]